MKIHSALLLSAAFFLTPARAEVPANLVTENIPPLPPEIIANASRYVEFRAAALQSWHPRNREMLITTRFGATPQLHLLKQPGGARKQLTFSSEPIGAAFWRPGAGRVLFIRRTRVAASFSSFTDSIPRRAARLC